MGKKIVDQKYIMVGPEDFEEEKDPNGEEQKQGKDGI